MYGDTFFLSFTGSWFQTSACAPVQYPVIGQVHHHKYRIEFRSSPSKIKKVGSDQLHSFLIRKLFFQAQAEYSYFSADFRPKIIWYYP